MRGGREEGGSSSRGSEAGGAAELDPRAAGGAGLAPGAEGPIGHGKERGDADGGKAGRRTLSSDGHEGRAGNPVSGWGAACACPTCCSAACRSCAHSGSEPDAPPAVVRPHASPCPRPTHPLQLMSAAKSWRQAYDKHVSQFGKKQDALFDAAVVADQNAKLSIFCTRPAIYAPVRAPRHGCGRRGQARVPSAAPPPPPATCPPCASFHSLPARPLCSSAGLQLPGRVHGHHHPDLGRPYDVRPPRPAQRTVPRPVPLAGG